MSVQEMVSPRGVAIVGASDTRYYARSLILNLRNAGYEEARIFPVNPRYESVCDVPCYSSLIEIGKPISVVVIATASPTVPGMVREAADVGAAAVVVLADGYAEQDEEGKRRQDELEVLAKEVGVAILGPNTLGYVAPPEGAVVWAPGELKTPVKAGGIGVVFQSSGMMNLFMNLCITRGLGLRGAFSVGNEAGISTADCIDFYAKDDATKIIVAMVETTNGPRDLAAALHAAQRAGKPVVMLKLGRSDRARQNAVAHTGRMASEGRSWDALLDRLGVVVVDDLDELVECTTLFGELADHPRLRRESAPTGCAFVTVSGGDCSLLCDLAESQGVPIAELAEPTHRKLAEVMEKPDLVGNPLDLENLYQVDKGLFRGAIDTLCGDPAVDVVAYRMYLPGVPTDSTMDLYRDLAEWTRAAGKAPVVLSRAIEDLDRRWYTFFNELQVPFLPAYRPGLKSLARLSAWSDQQPIAGELSLRSIPERMSADADYGSAATWEGTQEILRKAGVPYAPAILVDDENSAAAAARQLGFPVAVKLFARDAPHKSDIGGVRLGLSNADEVSSALADIRTAAERAAIAPEGFEVQKMAPSGGVEVILGVIKDAAIGPLIMVGMGGVLTEITRDIVLTVPVVEPQDAERLLRRLTSFPLLGGYRGSRPADYPALARVVAELSAYAAENADSLAGLDVNPVMVLPEGQGVVAVDALALVR